MASLKDLRNKISAVESTRKVTEAMKLVAGVKLRKSEQKAVVSREYAFELNGMLARLKRKLINIKSELFCGRERVKTVFLIAFASDRGLCGNFNYLVGKETVKIAKKLRVDDKNVRVMCIGNKLSEYLKKFASNFIKMETIPDFYRSESIFDSSKELSQKVISEFISGEADEVRLIYTRYFSVIRHAVENKKIIPVPCELSDDKTETIFEPSAEKVLHELLPFNIAIQFYQAALESMASEQSSRMTSMDNATRNADNLLSEFRIRYNRTRQAKITSELVEVISGAKAISKE